MSFSLKCVKISSRAVVWASLSVKCSLAVGLVIQRKARHNHVELLQHAVFDERIHRRRREVRAAGERCFLQIPFWLE